MFKVTAQMMKLSKIFRPIKKKKIIKQKKPKKMTEELTGSYGHSFSDIEIDDLSPIFVKEFH